ncbi:Retron-type reverse transcriptase [Microvirga lotononidis]|uniref:Retron-type reverse transcriptase n=1 Tax=Microvirga lotononidis TaxID=864069 RepID=I4Z441_9HYPH|nr:Retron-type reverse transcriptase [Microvirga lotononidis]
MPNQDTFIRHPQRLPHEVHYEARVPSVTDRLVQEVVRSILEVIYEPVFSDHSHGFRPKRSCHTALTNIKNVWSGVKWFVEADIKGFFDNLDHKIMMTLLAKKIDDKNFLRLIASFLAAGYLEDWKYHNTYSGTPQGGIVSPILSNIYLHELDRFMERWIEARNKGKERRGHPPWISITARIGYIRKKIRTLQERVEDLQHMTHSPEGTEDIKDEIANVMAQIVELEAELKASKIQQFSVPSKVADDPSRNTVDLSYSTKRRRSRATHWLKRYTSRSWDWQYAVRVSRLTFQSRTC